MKAPRERGREGTWLRESRIDRGYRSADDAALAVAKLTGTSVPVSQWRSYESGLRKMSERHRRALEEFFGPMPAPAPEGTVDLAIAVRELLDEVRLLRVAQETSAQALGEMAGLAAALLARASTPNGPALPDGGGSLLGR